MRIVVLAALLSLAQSVQAQDVSEGVGAMLRGLDKVDGHVEDMEMSNGDVAGMGRLSVVLHECRYPAGNPAGDAYALMTISDDETNAPIFAGWMIASSPALNALEHPRYDVWVLRCRTE